MHMLSAEFGWLGKPEKGFRPRNVNASHYFARAEVALNVKVICNNVTSVRICNKHWKTKPKVHSKYVKLAFLLTTSSWIAVLNRPQTVWTSSSNCFRFNKSIAPNCKILNRFRFGFENRLHPIALSQWTPLLWRYVIDLRTGLNIQQFRSHTLLLCNQSILILKLLISAYAKSYKETIRHRMDGHTQPTVSQHSV